MSCELLDDPVAEKAWSSQRPMRPAGPLALISGPWVLWDNGPNRPPLGFGSGDKLRQLGSNALLLVSSLAVLLLAFRLCKMLPRPFLASSLDFRFRMFKYEDARVTNEAVREHNNVQFACD